MIEPIEEKLRRAYTTADSAQAHHADCPSGEEHPAARRGERQEGHRLQVLDRALRCAACRSELAVLSAVSENRAPGQPRVPFSWRKLVPLAAAASIVLLIGIFGDQFWQGGEQTVRAGNEGA